MNTNSDLYKMNSSIYYCSPRVTLRAKNIIFEVVEYPLTLGNALECLNECLILAIFIMYTSLSSDGMSSDGMLLTVFIILRLFCLCYVFDDHTEIIILVHPYETTRQKLNNTRL